jgi:hypothetical protein
MRNLAHSLGVFHGFNDELRSENLSGRGTGAISTLMFDQIHLIAIRVHALIVRPHYPTDVSLGTFGQALHDNDIRRQLIERAVGFYGPSRAEATRKDMVTRIESFVAEYERLNGDGAAKLRTLRNKVLAHISTEADSIPPVVLRTLWDLGDKTLTLGGEVSLIFREITTDYPSERKSAMAEARSVISFIRSGILEEREQVERARNARRSSKKPAT